MRANLWVGSAIDYYHLGQITHYNVDLVFVWNRVLMQCSKETADKNRSKGNK